MEEQKEGHAADAASAQKRKRWPIVVALVAIVVVCAGAGMWVWHGQPSFCSTVCHNTMDSYVQSWDDSSYTVHAHAQQGVTCLDCHKPELSDQIQEAAKQLSGNYTLPLAKMETGDDFCLRAGCHNRADIEQATANMVVDGTAINPHTQTVNAASQNPHDGSGQKPACSECHSMHRPSKSLNYCYSCHHAQTFEVCETCHNHH